MNRMLLNYISRRPELYEPSSSKFWDDEHISKGMLEAHLDPEVEAATRKLEFVLKSVEWITRTADPLQRPKLLDLGCGPGIYAGLLSEKGFDVTGIDISPRSVLYARESAAVKNMDIDYQCRNYLGIDYDGMFDVITLIYCDFGVLNPSQRESLLGKIYKALKPDGLLIFDVCSPVQYESRPETHSWSYSDGGFWSAEPYACLYSFYRYDDCRTFAEQYVIIGESSVRCYNIWNHRFTVHELQRDLKGAGFAEAEFYSDVSGEAFTDKSNTFCAVAHKR